MKKRMINKYRTIIPKMKYFPGGESFSRIFFFCRTALKNYLSAIKNRKIKDGTDGEMLPLFQDSGFNVEQLCSSFPLWNLQQFAAEDEGRTEEPSEQKKRKEREKGRVAKSQEIPGALVLIAGVLVMYFVGEWILHSLSRIMTMYLGGFNSIYLPTNPVRMASMLKGLAWETTKLLAPVIGAAFIFGVLGNIIQVGFMFSTEPLMMKWERIKPNFKKVLFSLQTLVNLIKAVLKVLLIGWVAYIIISSEFLTLLQSGKIGISSALSLVSFIAFKLMLVVSIIFLVLSVPDYLYQRYEFTESIKMTPAEMKREIKDTEGDAFIKQRQREMSREIAKRNMLKEVPKATVVITNPTHFAVAVQFEIGVDLEPKVIAKGQDTIAQKIVEIAKEHDIEVKRNVALARALYFGTEVGQAIDRGLWEVLVRVIASLKKFRRAG